MWCGEKCAPLPGSDVRLLLPLMPLSRLVARHSRMLSRSYGGRVCGAVACVWPVLTRLLSVPCLGHNNRTRGAAQGPSKPRNRQMSQPGSPRAGPSQGRSAAQRVLGIRCPVGLAAKGIFVVPTSIFVCAPLLRGRLHAKGYTLAHHLQSGSPGRSAHGGGTPGPGQPAVTRLSA